MESGVLRVLPQPPDCAALYPGYLLLLSVQNSCSVKKAPGNTPGTCSALTRPVRPATMRAMNKSIQIFRPGKHVTASGVALEFSESDLAATAAAYDPAQHDAPLVVGHPQHDNPAYGWVGKLAFAEGALEAEPVQLNPDFSEMVKSGAFKKISAAFYAPTAPNNPVPGVYYLRHVGFLGAMPPSVKGLRNPQFSDTEEGVIEFAEIEIKSSHEPQPEGEAMSDADKARLAVLEEENKTLKAEHAAFAEADKKRAADAIHTDHLAFAEGLVKEGKLLPAQKEVLVATLDHLADPGPSASSGQAMVEFGEGDAKQPLRDAFKALLQALHKQVEFAEVSGGKGEVDAPDAADSKAISAKAIEFMEAEARAGRAVSATEAVNHVTKGGK